MAVKKRLLLIDDDDDLREELHRSMTNLKRPAPQPQAQALNWQNHPLMI